MCIDNFFSAAQGVLEFAAIVRLRIKRPEMARPYKIPLSTAGLVLFLIVPICWSLLICYVTVTDSVQAAVTICIGLVVGVLLYVPFLWWDRAKLEIRAKSEPVPDEVEIPAVRVSGRSDSTCDRDSTT
jgi:amino acid transporter